MYALFSVRTVAFCTTTLGCLRKRRPLIVYVRCVQMGSVGSLSCENLFDSSPRTFVNKSVRITSLGISPEAIEANVKCGLENVKAIIQMASKSTWYKHIPLELIQDMATHGLIIHPTSPTYLTYLTCDHHFRRGNHICWTSAAHLEAHLNSKHKKLYAEWRCQDAAATKPSQEDTEDDDAIDSTDSIDEPGSSSTKRPLTGVWAEVPPSHSQDAVSSGSAGMMMPSPAAAASSAQAPEPKSWRRSSPFNVFTDQQTNELEEDMRRLLFVAVDGLICTISAFCAVIE